jgi:integrase
MGSIYNLRHRSAAGEQVESPIYWLKYRDATGKIIRQPSGTADLHEAKRLLKVREGAAAEGKVIVPRADKVTINDLATDLRAEYAANGRRSADRLEFSLAHILPVLGTAKAQHLTTAAVTGYTVKRQEAGAANATINRELAALKRMLRLAAQGEKITRVAHINMLREDNVRRGFFEREQFEAVRRHLPEALQPVATFAYTTGWRKHEILGLTWDRVDFFAGTVRLDAGTTKSGEGRTFPMTAVLRDCLVAQREATEALQKRTGSIIPWVFHRGGRPIKDLRGAWDEACRLAGVPGRLLHDCRRTAVRNLERAGVSRSVGMSLTGHKTEAVFRRYAIVDSAVQAEARGPPGRPRRAAGQEGAASGGTTRVRYWKYSPREWRNWQTRWT